MGGRGPLRGGGGCRARSVSRSSLREPTESYGPIGRCNVNLSCRHVKDYEVVEDVRLFGAGEPGRQGFETEVDTEPHLICDPFFQAEREIGLGERSSSASPVPNGDGLTDPSATSRNHWPSTAASHVVRVGSSKDHVLPSARTTAPLICSQLASQSRSPWPWRSGNWYRPMLSSTEASSEERNRTRLRMPAGRCRPRAQAPHPPLDTPRA